MDGSAAPAVTEANPAPAPAAAAAAIAAAAPAAAEVAPAPNVNDWRTGIGDEALRGEAAIANYGSLDDFVKGHLSTKALASSKVPMPGDTPESQQAFADAIRPADAAAYEISVPEGYGPEFADGFRGIAHDAALQPWQVSKIVQWNNEFISGELKKASDASEAEVAEFKGSYTGNYDAQLGKVGLMLKQAGVELSEEDLGALDAKLGSANLLRFMFNIADRVGPLEHIDGDDPEGLNGGVAPEQADGVLNEKQKNAEWRKNAQIKGSAENKEYERLTRLIAQHRARQQR